MSAQVATSKCNMSNINTINTPSNQINIDMLIKENATLREANEKLYKRTLNQRRKLLRLKRQLESGVENDDIDNNDPESNHINITDNVWEDVEEVMASYNIGK
jgi:hypothetical protein